jgi:hypothetical protein
VKLFLDLSRFLDRTITTLSTSDCKVSRDMPLGMPFYHKLSWLSSSSFDRAKFTTPLVKVSGPSQTK